MQDRNRRPNPFSVSSSVKPYQVAVFGRADRLMRFHLRNRSLDS